jgi:hypothetical protein
MVLGFPISSGMREWRLELGSLVTNGQLLI